MSLEIPTELVAQLTKKPTSNLQLNHVERNTSKRVSIAKLSSSVQ